MACALLQFHGLGHVNPVRLSARQTPTTTLSRWVCKWQAWVLDRVSGAIDELLCLGAQTEGTDA